MFCLDINIHYAFSLQVCPVSGHILQIDANKKVTFNLECGTNVDTSLQNESEINI